MARISLFAAAALVVGGASGCLVQGDALELSGQHSRVTFLHTADLHSRLFPFAATPTPRENAQGLYAANAPLGGAARLAFLINRERQRGSRVLHLDAGAWWEGAPIFAAAAGEPELRFLSTVGVDASVIGLRELEGTGEGLATKLDSWASFPLLAANLLPPTAAEADDPSLAAATAPYATFDLDGIRVAVIGLAYLGATAHLPGTDAAQVTLLEPNETVRAYVNQLHDAVDLIVLLSHLGVGADEALITGYQRTVRAEEVRAGWEVVAELGDGEVSVSIPGVRHVDLILGGRDHRVHNPPLLVTDADGRAVPVVHSGAFGTLLGRLDAVLAADDSYGGQRIVSHKLQLFPVDARLADDEDAAVNELLTPYERLQTAELDPSRVLAVAAEIISAVPSGGHGDSPLGNLLADAMRAHTGATLALTWSSGLRDEMRAGPVTLGDLFNVLPSERRVRVLTLTGADLQALLDQLTAQAAAAGCFSLAQVSGLSFTMDCGQAAANAQSPGEADSPAIELLVDGTAVAPAHLYTLAIDEDLARGAFGLDLLRRNSSGRDTGVTKREMLRAHLVTRERCSPPVVAAEQAELPCVSPAAGGRIKRRTRAPLAAHGDAAGPGGTP